MALRKPFADDQKEEKSISINPELYTPVPGVKLDLNDLKSENFVIDEYSALLLSKGKTGQRYAYNDYIDGTTGIIYRYYTPTVIQKKLDETEEEKIAREESERLIREAKFELADVAEAPPNAVGIVHHNAHNIICKRHEKEMSTTHVHLKTKYRLGGSLNYFEKPYFVGRSAMNWSTLKLNEVFLYANYYELDEGVQTSFVRKPIWPPGVHINRAQPWNYINAGIMATLPFLPKHISDNLDEVKEKSLTKCDPEAYKKDWEDLLKNHNHKSILGELMSKTIYIASGLGENKSAPASIPDESVVANTLKVAKEYGISINVDYIPKNFENSNGATALIHAVKTGKAFIAHLLITHGADIYFKDEAGRSARDYALESSDLNLKSLFIKKELQDKEAKQSVEEIKRTKPKPPCMSRDIQAYLDEAEKIAKYYRKNASIFTIDMKKKATEIETAIEYVKLVLNDLKTVDEVANYKNGKALSVNEALSIRRKFGASPAADLHLKLRRNK